MTDTSQPASRSAWLSCHTLRSNGTDRSATRISAVPARAHVSRLGPTRLGAGDSDEVDHYSVHSRRSGVQHRLVLAADHAHVGVLEHVVDRAGQQVAEVRQALL